MDIQKTIRAWKDADYRRSLAPEEQALLPENPAGLVDLSEAELGMVAGAGSNCDWSFGCCPFFTTSCPPTITQSQVCTSPY